MTSARSCASQTSPAANNNSGSGVASPNEAVRRSLDRALPGPKIDKIRDGVPGAGLCEGGGKAVWSALLSTAASAYQRGWDCWEWQELVLSPSSALGRQVQLRDGRKPQSKMAVQKILDSAWDKATAWTSEQPPPHTRKEMAQDARARADALLLVAQDPAWPLLAADRRVLAYACELAKTRGINRVALPWRGVVEGTGVGERSVKNALRRLVRLNLLWLEERGKPGTYRARAALYALLPVPVNGSVGPPAQICGTSRQDALGTPTAPVLRAVAGAGRGGAKTAQVAISSPAPRGSSSSNWSDDANDDPPTIDELWLGLVDPCPRSDLRGLLARQLTISEVMKLSGWTRLGAMGGPTQWTSPDGEVTVLRLRDGLPVLEVPPSKQEPAEGLDAVTVVARLYVDGDEQRLLYGVQRAVRGCRPSWLPPVITERIVGELATRWSGGPALA